MWIPFGFAICRRPRPHFFGGNQGSAAEDDEPHSVWEKPPQTTDSQMQEHLFSHLGFFLECPASTRRTISCWKDFRLCLIFPFTTTMGCIRASRLLIEATCRPEKPSREIKMRLGRKQNPFQVQTQGKVQTGNISHHSSKYTLVCHVAEVLSQAGQNHWNTSTQHPGSASWNEVWTAFSAFWLPVPDSSTLSLLYMFQGRPSLKGVGSFKQLTSCHDFD